MAWCRVYCVDLLTIVILLLLIACGFDFDWPISSTSKVPDTVADRLARLHHGYVDPLPCNAYEYVQKPAACQAGSDDAQAVAAWSNLAICIVSLLGNPVLGSGSDRYGRKTFLLLSVTAASFPAITFACLLCLPQMHPVWYYFFQALSLSTNFVGMMLAAVADVATSVCSDGQQQQQPPRSAAYGLFMGAFYSGYAAGPFLTYALHGPVTVAITGSAILVVAVLVTLLWLPETLPPTRRRRLHLDSFDQHTPDQQGQLEGHREHLPPPPALHDEQTDHLLRVESDASDNHIANSNEIDHHRRHCDRAILHATRNTFFSRLFLDRCWKKALLRPWLELTILNRSSVLRTLTVASFLSSMVMASDQTLLLYYIQDTLNVRVVDLANMFLIWGFLGLVLQGGVLACAVQRYGESNVLISTFWCGTAHNAMYGLARSKSTICFGLAASQWTKCNMTLLAYMVAAAPEVTDQEQGRIQGALAAVNGVAYALGPLCLEWIYHQTKQNRQLGPGFMFVCAAGLYLIGTFLVSCMPISHKEFISQHAVAQSALVACPHGDDMQTALILSQRAQPARRNGSDDEGLTSSVPSVHKDDLQEPLLGPSTSPS